MVRYTAFPTAIGDCAIAWAGHGATASDDIKVVGTALPAVDGANGACWLQSRFGGDRSAPPMAIEEIIAAITQLLAGEAISMAHIPCDLSGSTVFARNVYDLTRAIPCGETRTYGDIAGVLGDIALARRVGQALGQNPCPILIPCHRVMGADGRLTGFSAPGGLATKLKLLDIEQAATGAAHGLFGHLPLATGPGK